MTTNPFQQPDSSIVNDILDLDEFLSADVRRAEKTEILYTKPHLEAEIDALEHELQGLTDGSGATIVDDEASVGESGAGDGRSAEVVAKEIQTKRQEYAASGRKVRLRQLHSEHWMAFEAKWKEALSKGAPYPPEMWDDLIARCAVEPKIPADKAKALRGKLGHPPLHKLALACWALNTEVGVSVPFSPLSSRVLRPERRGRN